MNSSPDKQLEDIKRLLMVLLLKLGATSEELGLALEVDSSRIRQILPVRKIQKISDDSQRGAKGKGS